MRQFLLITPILLAMTPTLHAVATCYYPDGVTTEPAHIPCNQTISSSSACCNMNDSCSVSGMCLGSRGFVYRGSCTDRTWTSGNCPATQWTQCITDPSTNTKYSGFTAVWSCAEPGTQEKEWCCAQGDSSKSCCNQSFDIGFTGRAFKPGLDTFVANLTSAAATATTTITQQATGLSPGVYETCDDEEGNGNLGTKVGLGVGIPLGVLGLGLLSWLFWREHKKRHGHSVGAVPIPQHSPLPDSSSPMTYGDASEYNPPSKYVAQLPSSPIHEVSANANLHELRG